MALRTPRPLAGFVLLWSLALLARHAGAGPHRWPPPTGARVPAGRTASNLGVRQEGLALLRTERLDDDISRR